MFIMHTRCLFFPRVYLNVLSVPPTLSQPPPTRAPIYPSQIHLNPDHRGAERQFNFNFNPRTPHDCSLAFFRFLLQDGLLSIVLRKSSDVFGAFPDSRKVTFELTSFFIGNLVFRVPFLRARLFSLGTYQCPCYLYNFDHVSGGMVLVFHVVGGRKQKGWGRSLLRLAACSILCIQSSTYVKEK